MIRFLKAIRQKSLAQNNIVRYLLYAIGEIVLVVIGILIALAITDWNDTRKKEQKIQLVFEDILSDLASDITSINNLIQYYEEKDTLINLVLYGNLTYEDYNTYKMPGLWYLTTNYSEAILVQNGYNNLIQDLDALPLKYKPIVQDLNILYGNNKHYLISFNL
jgi:type II secretory pathway pseudopilin PulG